MAAVKKDEKWGYIDKTGKEIVPCEYDELDFTIQGNTYVIRVNNSNHCYLFTLPLHLLHTVDNENIPEHAIKDEK
jgi:hypothetical protein